MGPLARFMKLFAAGVDPSGASLTRLKKLDFNGDEVIDNSDVDSFETNLGGLSGSAYDLNQDGTVDINDVVYLYDNLSAFNSRYQELLSFDTDRISIVDCSAELQGVAATVKNENEKAADVTIFWEAGGREIARKSGRVAGNGTNILSASADYSHLSGGSTHSVGIGFASKRQA